ncbi:MAG TPA: homocysteine S-methyltransferase family protein [Bacteroidota bacterium]|nr:homocysteine S-methyltransferase family protein [Bacteroidota bacterium]
MMTFRERLRAPGPMVGDGALGTMLQQRGLKPGQCPEKLNLDRPEVLEDVARLYVEAGADIVETNTFGGTPLKLAQYGLEARTQEINARAVAAVRKAAGGKVYVSGSCGPCGKMLEPYGDTPAEVIFDAFCTQIRSLAAEGVDLLCIETMTDLSEASLAIQAAKSVAPALPVCATMTFDPTPRGFFTIMGVSIPQAVEGLSKGGADVVGSNCGNGIDAMVRIAEEFIRHARLPLIIQSNAGIPKLIEGTAMYPEGPDFMAEKSRILADHGVKIIGGCCGTTPAHIAAIRKMVDGLVK